jgi:hypothetical protein
MEKLVKVQAMKSCYYEHANRPDSGKLYHKGDIFEVEEDRISDYDNVRKAKNGTIVRGTMKRLEKKPDAAPAGKSK